MLPPKVQFKRRARAEANRLAAIARRAKTIPCKLVGRAFYRPHVPLCPIDAIRVAREDGNPHDANAHVVCTYMDGEWAKVGYVDRQTAARLRLHRIRAARIVASAAGSVPIEVDVA